MNFEYERTPDWLRWAVPFLTWRMPTSSNKVYLTFDDGPTPGVTDRILDILDQHAAKATFFFLGSMVEKHPELAQETLRRGHAIGNHGFAHLSGWKSGLYAYLADARKGRLTLENTLRTSIRMFRPPYGQIGPFQGYFLWWCYRIVMWDVVSQDYRADHTAETVHAIVKKHLRSGSIVLLHDSELAAPRVLPVLPLLLEHIDQQGLKPSSI